MNQHAETYEKRTEMVDGLDIERLKIIMVDQIQASRGTKKESMQNLR